MAIKKCAICGNDFETGGNGKVCENCHVGKCAVCGKEIRYTQYQLKQVLAGRKVSCSNKCRGAVTKMNLMASEGIENVSQRESVRANTYKRTCQLCGEEFDGARNARFCPSCKTVKCVICGKEFQPSAPRFSAYLKQGWLTCSAKCGAAMAKRNLMEREGITNVSERPEVKEKIRQARFNDSDETKEKRSEAIRNAYGDGSVIEKRKETCRERYGVDSALALPEVYSKGVEVARSPESRTKAMDTYAKNHDDAKTPFQTRSVMQGIIDSRNEKKAAQVDAVRDYLVDNPDATPRKICRELGVKYHALLQYNREFNLGIKLRHSSYEEAFKDALIERGVDYEREYRMQVDGLNDRRNCPRYDFLVGDTLVEIDPWHYHNSTFVDAWYEKDLEPHEPSYHLKKSRYAMEHEGKFCVHVFDWDDYELVADMFTPKTFAGARSFELSVFNGANADVDAFLNKNHLQGACRGVITAIALSDVDGIAAVMTFGRPRYDKVCDWELLRYCVRSGLAINGGAERLWSAFVKEHDGSVVSYCDNAKFDGGVYKRLGFENTSVQLTPHLHWYNPDTGQHFTAAYVNQLGVDKILGTSYGKGAKNEELMLKEGFVEIYDCGQSRWVYAE